MTTSSTSAMSEILPPPSERNTAWGWLRKNLFSGWGNSLLTIVSALLIVAILRPFLSWMFTSAEWAVIPANWNLIMRGQYPAEEIWRLWVSLYLLAAVVGLGWGVWGRNVRGTTIVVFSIPLLLMLLPWLSMAARLNLLVMEAIAIAFYVVGYARLPRIERVATVAVVLYFPAVVLLVRGLGITALMPVVPSNLWGGLLLSLLLSVVGIVFSFPLGVLLALGRQSSLPAVRGLSVLYIEFIRGVPLISLLFMSQVMLQIFLPAAMPPIDRVVRAMVAITLFSAAYTAENVRGGLQSIPNGQYEAAHALGLSSFQTMTRIILPQAIVAVIPVLVGQFIGLFKDTSLVALVGLFDLLGIARVILANPDWLGTQQEVYLVVGGIYWIFSYAMSYTSRQLEVTLGTGNRN
jgi:general L-amino acid transport system permease protein